MRQPLNNGLPHFFTLFVSFFFYCPKNGINSYRKHACDGPYYPAYFPRSANEAPAEIYRKHYGPVHRINYFLYANVFFVAIGVFAALQKPHQTRMSHAADYEEKYCYGNSEHRPGKREGKQLIRT